MKKYIFLIIFLFPTNLSFAPSGYTSEIEKGYQMLEEAESTTDYQEALFIYKKTFSTYPDSVEFTGLNDAAYLSAKLSLKDDFFKYAEKMISFSTDSFGTPTWEYFIGEEMDDSFLPMTKDLRWKPLEEKAQKNTTQINHIQC